MITKILKIGKYFYYVFSCRKCQNVLIDTPTHGNLGDHAIAMAEQQIFETGKIKYIELTANLINNIEDWYAKVTPKSCNILVHGGGFLGSLWPNEELRFRRILQTFKRHNIIVFPQTVYFEMETPEGRAFFEESKAIYSSHPSLLVFVREDKSYKFMKTYMPEVNVCLVPDVVTILKTEQKPSNRSGILLCMRSDIEKTFSDDEMMVLHKMNADICPAEKIEQTDMVVNYSILPKRRKEEVYAKLKQFSKAKIVITDRLHGMIFAAITETPCIVLNSKSPKMKGGYEWLKNLGYIRFVGSVNDIALAYQEIKDVDCKYDNSSILQRMKPLIDVTNALNK